MFTKPAASKKKDSSKHISSYLKNEDDDIRAELEALTGLEYNLHGEKPTEIPEVLPKVKKSRSKSQKKPKAMDSEKPPPREKIEVESQIPNYSSTASARELQSIIRQPGNTSEDKYKILEARDKLMRLKQVKSHTLETAKVTRGTCPDMCPEKERLMREFQRQVASYELANATEYKIYHEKAVKQYSRSSADQEEPMPQDLRPVNSLKMTMSYLLHEIVDLCQEEGTNLAEWFHFLWDRTRGIRKDITQQELCCLDTVELVEQCARFHIICSERLASEDSAVFDKKINTENLTKCLQTLKYMYHDLRVQGITCKNEAEFRGYIILLNLNNTNFMWDLQKLPKSIQSSAEVKFAIQVFSAIQSNNYAKFFKLVKETTYLNACILLRYFFQVRAAGLSVMVKAYCRTTSTSYPLYEFIDILGFDDESEAIVFCEQAGLNISSDEFNIVLNRQNVILPPPAMDDGRAITLIESKRLKMGHSFGQVIAGGSMPDQLYLNHVPHNSFDAQGYLKPAAINASDQNSGIIDEGNDPYEYMEDDIEEQPRPLRREKTIETQDEEELGEEEEEEEDYDEDYEEEEEFMDEEEEEVEDEEELDESEPPPQFQSKLPPVFSKPLATTNIFKQDFKFTPETDRDSKMSIDSASSLKSAENTPFGKTQGFSFAPPNQTNIFAKPDANKSHSIFAGASQGNIFAKPIPAVSTVFQTPSVPVIKPHAESIFKIPEPVKPRESPTKRKTEEEVQRERKRMEEERLRLEREKARMEDLARERMVQEIDKNSRDCADLIEEEVIHDICSTILKEEIEKMKVFDQLSEKVAEDLIKELVHKTCREVLEGELEFQERLHQVCSRIQNRRVLKYYRTWRQNVAKKRRQREALDNTPVWLPSCSLTACAKSLYRKDQDLVIQNMRKRRSRVDLDDSDLTFIAPVETKIYKGLKENAKTLDVDVTSIMFWKIVISWPLLENRVLLWRHKNIMSQYLCPGDCFMDPIIKTYKPNPYETLNMCFKHCEGIAKDHHVTGMDALFFIASSDEDPKMVARRLSRTVLSRQKLQPIPLVLVIFGCDPQNVEPTRELESLVQSEYISEYTVHHERAIDEGTVLKLTQTAMLWLTMNKASPIPLEMDYLKDVVDTSLTDELWMRISGHAPFNDCLGYAIDDPKFIVDLHNEAVNRLIDIILDPESLMYTDFPTEFKSLLPREFDVPCSYEYFNDDWKNEDIREQIERTLESFTLPPWPFDWPINDTMELHKCVNRYCHLTLDSSHCKTISGTILSNIFFMSKSDNKPGFVVIIVEILKEKIRMVESDLTVVYNKNHLKMFRTIPWWFKSSVLLDFETKMNQSMREVQAQPSMKRRRVEEEQTNEDMCRIIEEYDSICEAEYEKDISSLFEQSKTHLSEVQSISNNLEKILEQQQLANKKFEERLAAALGDEKLDL